MNLKAFQKRCKNKIRKFSLDNIEILRLGNKKFISAKMIPLSEQKVYVYSKWHNWEIKDRKAFAKYGYWKRDIIKGNHHRVKNNLQTISSLLDLQAESITEPKA